MALSDSEILLTIKLNGPMTTAALREQLGITQQGVRQRLALLAQAGLLRQESEKSGVGRPSACWSLTAEGHARFPDGHAELTASLIQDVTQLFGAAGLESLIARREGAQAVRYRDALADCQTLRERLERLTELRQAEGYMADLSLEADGSFLLTEHHCPICAAATACQGFCRSELALFTDLVGAEASIERSQHLLSGDQRCSYRITPQGTKADLQGENSPS